MADQEIYVSPEVDGAGAPVIRVGGDCYEYVEPSDQEPTVAMIDGEFADCDACVPAPCTCPGGLAKAYHLVDPGVNLYGCYVLDGLCAGTVPTGSLYADNFNWEPYICGVWDGSMVGACPRWATPLGCDDKTYSLWGGLNSITMNRFVLGLYGPNSECGPCPANPAFWGLILPFHSNTGNDVFWVGRKFTGDSPVGIYQGLVDATSGICLQIPTTMTVT